MRTAFFISGGGTTLEQLLIACRLGVLRGLIEPVLIVASEPGLGGIARAISTGFNSDSIHVCERGQYGSQYDFGRALIELCQRYAVELVEQCGWIKLTPANFIDQFCGKVLNQHPGGTDPGHPGFGGRKMVGPVVHQTVLGYLRETNPPENRWYTQPTCHFATEKYDEGPILWLGQVPVYPDDTAESLAARVLPVEWAVQTAALYAVATRTAKPIIRSERLIAPGSEAILERCKAEAIAMYSHG
jgi:phosphoribosylglycinamide formyltransferase 1